MPGSHLRDAWPKFLLSGLVGVTVIGGIAVKLIFG